MADAGNKYRHEYEDVAERVVWATVQDALPPLHDVIGRNWARTVEATRARAADLGFDVDIGPLFQSSHSPGTNIPRAAEILSIVRQRDQKRAA